MLQIENEFYSAIRPKRVAQAGETALTALCRRGVEYIEVRCLDINPFDPLGISAEQIRFLDTFLLWCLLTDSPACNSHEFETIIENQKRVVNTGRAPGLTLLSSVNEKHHSATLVERADQTLQEMQGIAELMDNAQQKEGLYTRSLSEQQAKIFSPELTPSAQMLDQMQCEDLGYVHWGLKQSEQHRVKLKSEPLPGDRQRRMEDMAEESLRLRESEEQQSQLPFDEYIKQYYAQYAKCEGN